MEVVMGAGPLIGEVTRLRVVRSGAREGMVGRPNPGLPREVAPADGETKGLGFDDCAGFGDFLPAVRVCRGNGEPTIVQSIRQPLTNESEQCLADNGEAYAEFCGEFPGAQRLSGLVIATEDARTEGLVNAP